MPRRAALLAFLLIAGVLATSAQAPPALSVQRAGPTGEISTLEQANEIRIVFSEPMVTLGRIPQPVTAPFVHIEPALKGSFRWSGTTILIFTPDRADRPRYSTAYRVTVDRSARAVSGRQLAAPYVFTFTTPTVHVLRIDHERLDGRADRPTLLLVRFNQAIQPDAVVPHLRVRLQPHDWPEPMLTQEAQARMAALDPVGLQEFRAKVAAVDAVARSSAPITVRRASRWDTKRFPPSPDLLALETVTAVAPESWLQVTLDTSAPSPEGRATPTSEQSQTLELEHAFFVKGFRCTTQCDPSGYNAIELTRDASAATVQRATSVTDITGGRIAVVPAPTQPPQRREFEDETRYFSLEDLRFPTQPPVTTYAVRLDRSLEASDGQRLGYPWNGIVETWHEMAFTSFGDGHGVWERSGGAQLPFFARNVQTIRQWVTSIAPADLMPRILALTDAHFRSAPPGDGRERRLAVQPDKIQSHGLDVAPALSGKPTGLVWAAVQEDSAIPQSKVAWNAGARAEERRKSTIVQVTNLGITVKDSPVNTLIFVTRLDNGEPVSGAQVSIVTRENRTFWRGTTNADGFAIAPDTALRNRRKPWELAFIVIAEKDGDVAYAGSDWNEGIWPWAFGLRTDPEEALPVLRGTIFTDRGVYRLGEEVHAKAIVRSDTPRGIQLLPRDTKVYIVLRDAQYREVERRTLALNDWSSAEWTFTVPQSGTLGNYSIHAQLTPFVEAQRPVAPDDIEDAPRGLYSSFLVAAYRRPEFRVDATLTGGPNPTAGDALSAAVSARYLFGAAMANRPVRWSTSRFPVYSAPTAVDNKFPSGQWVFVGADPDDSGLRSADLTKDEGTVNRSGEFTVSVPTARDAARPYTYSFEAEVEDVSRQRIAARATRVVHPAPWYIGVKRPPFFTEQKNG
jgi:hypothetical protein